MRWTQLQLLLFLLADGYRGLLKNCVYLLAKELIFDANPPFPFSFLSGISDQLCVNILSVALRLTYSFMVLSTQITWGVFSGWSFLDWSVGAGPPSARVWLGPRLAPLSSVGGPV